MVICPDVLKGWCFAYRRNRAGIMTVPPVAAGQSLYLVANLERAFAHTARAGLSGLEAHYQSS
jgi:hypothetical protein